MRIRTAVIGATAATLLLAGACSSDDDSTTSTGDDTTETSPAAGVTVSDAWARPGPMATGAGAVYMELTSAEGDALIGASVDPSVAGEAQIHETTSSGDMDMTDDTMDEMSDDMGEMADDEMSDDMGEMSDDTTGDMDMGDGAMSMQEVDSIPLPAGETVSLEPGGYHIMLLELAEPLEDGTTFELTLMFEEAGEQTVTVTVGEPS